MAGTLAFSPAKNTPSEGYIGLYPGFQASPDVFLRNTIEGQASGGVGTLSAAEAWGTANRFSTLASANKHGVISRAEMRAKWNANDGTVGALIVACQVAATLPGAGTQTLLGTTASTRGFKLTLSSAGVLAINGYGDASVFGSNTTIVGATNYSLAVIIDGPARKWNFYINGARVIAGFETFATAGDITNSATDFIVGADLIGSVGVAAAWHGLHVVARPGALGSIEQAADAIALRLHRSPLAPLSIDEIGY